MWRRPGVLPECPTPGFGFQGSGLWRHAWFPAIRVLAAWQQASGLGVTDWLHGPQLIEEQLIPLQDDDNFRCACLDLKRTRPQSALSLLSGRREQHGYLDPSSARSSGSSRGLLATQSPRAAVHASRFRPKRPKNLRSRTSTMRGFNGKTGRTLYPSSESGSVECSADCHLL